MAKAPPPFIRPFALAGLALGVAGSTLGAVLLFRIDFSLGEVTPLWKQVHGQAQVFGFIVPLVIGFGTYLVPRIVVGYPIRPRLALVALLALGAAAVANGLTPFDDGVTVRRVLAVLVGVGAVAGALSLQAPLAARRREGVRAREHEHVLELALAFLALAGLANAAAWWTAEATYEAPQGFIAAAWRLSLEGFAVGMALSVSARMFSGFLGIEPSLSYAPGGRGSVLRSRVFLWAMWAWAASVALGSAASTFDAHALERVADIVFAFGIVPLAFQLGLARTGGGPAIDRTKDPLFPFGARTAYALLVAGALVGAGAGVADLLGVRVHTLWFDARRHLLTIGFLLVLIATMAGRLAPGFAGRPLALPWLRNFAMAAFGAAAVLRALEAVSGQWGPDVLLEASAWSGPLAVAALLGLAVCVGTTFARRR